MVEEKESPAHIYVEHHKETGSHDRDPNDDGVFLESNKRASAESRLLKKLDRRLLPTIVVIFIMNFIDVRQPLDSIFCVFTDLYVANSCDICQARWT